MRPSLRSHLACAALAVSAAACPSGDRGPGRPPSLLLITVDSLRADRTGFGGHAGARTPTMDGLAARGGAFRRALATAPEAVPSLASMHTGLYPARHGVRVSNDRAVPGGLETLAETLKRAGWRTGAVAGTLDLHRKFGLDQGFDVYAAAFDDIPRPRQFFEISHPAQAVADRALEFLEKSREAPFFLWVNFYDPHYFYTPPSPFKEDFAQSPYDGEVAYVDRELGRILAKIDDYGLRATTRIILAGSNGEGLGDAGEDYHGTTLSEATTRVPLVVVAPGFEPGARLDAPASLVDVTPTALSLLGRPVPEGLDGLSLTGSIDPERPLSLEAALPARLFGWRPLAGVVEGRWKYVEGARGELYDLAAGPGAAIDVSVSHPGERDRLAGLVAARLAVVLAAPAPGDEVKAAIRGLGYAAEPAARQSLDPRDRIDVANDALKAHRAALRRQIDAAAFLFEDVARRDPENYLGLLDSALIARSRRQSEADRRNLMRARDLYPFDGEVYHQIAHLFLSEGSPGGSERAHAHLAVAVALDPKNEEALYDLACTTAKRGRGEEALDLLEKAVREGYRDFVHMARDADLDSVRGLPRFETITGGRARPPEGSPGPAGGR